jgi:hypothetical protein
MELPALRFKHQADVQGPERTDHGKIVDLVRDCHSDAEVTPGGDRSEL